MIWNKVENKKPIASESGCWDGLKSGEILVCTRNRKYHVAVMYHVKMDGTESFDFYDDRDFEIENVISWTEIDAPF